MGFLNGFAGNALEYTVDNQCFFFFNNVNLAIELWAQEPVKYFQCIANAKTY